MTVEIEGKLTDRRTNQYVGSWIWGEGSDGHMKRLKNTYLLARAASEGIEKERERLAANKHLTEEGKQAALAGFVSKYARNIRLGRVALEAAHRAEAERRESIRPKPADPTDVVGAMRRQEIRSWLRESNRDQRKAALMNPSPEVAQAVVEMPAALSGVVDATHGRMTQAAIDHAHPGAMKELEDLIAATETTARALAAMASSVQVAAGVKPSLMDAWVVRNAEDVSEPDRPVVQLVNGEWMRVLRGENGFLRREATQGELEIGYRARAGESLDEAFQNAESLAPDFELEGRAAMLNFHDAKTD